MMRSTPKNPLDKSLWAFCRLQAVYLAPILNIFVPQAGQTALTAGLPFFMVTDSNFSTSFLALHFTQ